VYGLSGAYLSVVLVAQLCVNIRIKDDIKRTLIQVKTDTDRNRYSLDNDKKKEKVMSDESEKPT
jgi:hypothetical protein